MPLKIIRKSRIPVLIKRPQQIVVAQTKPKRKRKRAKRQRKRRGPGNLSSFSTINNIQRTLMSNAMQSPKSLSSYVHCRMNPFQSHKGPAAAIPSGDNENFVVIDNFMYDDITAVTGATFFIQTLPMLPVTAVISSISAAGTHDLNINNVNFLSSGNTNWGNYPIGVVTPYRALTLTPGIAVDDPYQSVSARMVSIGYKLTYTGQSATCSGTVTVTPNNVGFTLAGSLTASTGNIASPSAVSGNLANSAQTATVAAPLGSPILTIDLTDRKSVV